MNHKRRKLRREQLDQQFKAIGQIATLPTPKGGWIRAVREALGMTFEQVGTRLGVSKQSAQQLEIAEASESITVKRLRAAADALDCDLIVVLRPRKPLEAAIRERATNLARAQVTRTGHSMALESQAVVNEQLEQMIKDTANELIEKGDPRIWE